MKKAIILTFAALLLAAGCTSKSNKAADAASSFLHSYLEMDYETAYSRCTPELAFHLKSLVEMVEYPTEAIRDRIAESSRNTSFEIVSCDTETEKGKALITYNFITPDGRVLEKKMTLSYLNKEWLISEIK